MKTVRIWYSYSWILDKSKHYQKMSSKSKRCFWFICWCKRIHVEVFFENVEISKDVYNLLILPFKYSTIGWINQCLAIIFGSLSIITRGMLDDHLEDGKYSNRNQQLMKGTVSVSTTNSIAGCNFGMLYRFVREKPNTNMII